MIQWRGNQRKTSSTVGWLSARLHVETYAAVSRGSPATKLALVPNGAVLAVNGGRTAV